MKTKLLPILLMTVFLISSFSVSAQSEEFIKLGTLKAIKGTDFSIQFTELVDDSRCPSGTQCIWAGQVTVGINILKGDKIVKTFNLTLKPGAENLKSKIFKNRLFSLLEVTPYPSIHKTGFREYAVRLQVALIE